jgi:hypothetical protein
MENPSVSETEMTTNKDEDEKDRDDYSEEE